MDNKLEQALVLAEELIQRWFDSEELYIFDTSTGDYDRRMRLLSDAIDGYRARIAALREVPR